MHHLNINISTSKDYYTEHVFSVNRMFACPYCGQSSYNMTNYWAELDEEIASTPMPVEYRDQKVWILCKDCHKVREISKVVFLSIQATNHHV